ncbi:MAG: S8 family serine peptidase [Lachnospiraceae bacterium]|nr:S8 family serine peptidase [Lachnospiraceae bacterium]
MQYYTKKKKRVTNFVALWLVFSVFFTAIPVNGYAAEVLAGNTKESTLQTEVKGDAKTSSEMPIENGAAPEETPVTPEHGNDPAATEGATSESPETTPESILESGTSSEGGTNADNGQQENTQENNENAASNESPENGTSDETNTEESETKEESSDNGKPEDTVADGNNTDETVPKEESTEEGVLEGTIPEDANSEGTIPDNTTTTAGENTEIPKDTETEEESEEDTKKENKKKSKKNKKNKNQNDKKQKSKIKVTEVSDLNAFTSAVQAETAGDDLTPAYKFKENSKKMYVHGEQQNLEKKPKGTGEQLTVPEEVFSSDTKVDNAGIANGDGVVTLEAVAAVSDYEVVEQEDGVELINPWQNKRLLVRSPMGFDPKDAVSIIQGYDNMFIITYETEEAAKAAYEYLLTIPYLTVETDVTLSASTVVEKAGKEREEIKGQDLEQEITSLQEAVKEQPVQQEKKAENKKAEVTEPTAENTTESVPAVTPETLADLVVAVLDTGYDMSACDTARIVSGMDLTGSNTLQDENGHGTVMANIILENTKDSVKVMPVKVADAGGRSSSLKMYLGIRHAIESGADVMNISMSTYKPNDGGIIRAVIEEAKNKGIFVVGAAGNYGEDTAGYVPANVDAAIIVSAVNTDETLDTYSNHGATIDYCANGSVETRGLGNTKTTVSGTSVSAAIVSAVIGNIKAENSGISMQDTENRLRETAKDLGTAGWDTSYGYGMLSMDGITGKEEEKTETELPALLTCDWKSLPDNALSDLIAGTNKIYIRRFIDDLSESDKAELLKKDTVLHNQHVEVSYKEENGNLIETDRYVGTLYEYLYSGAFDSYYTQADYYLYCAGETAKINLNTNKDETKAWLEVTAYTNEQIDKYGVTAKVSGTSNGAIDFSKIECGNPKTKTDENGNANTIFQYCVKNVWVSKPLHSHLSYTYGSEAADDKEFWVLDYVLDDVGVAGSTTTMGWFGGYTDTSISSSAASKKCGKEKLRTDVMIGTADFAVSEICGVGTGSEKTSWLNGYKICFTNGTNKTTNGDWDITKASCTEDGLRKRDITHECSVCNSSYTTTEEKKITARSHNYGSTETWVSTTAATCVTAGEEKCSCINTETEYYTGCDYYKTRPTDALGHDMSGEWYVYTYAGCTTEGEKRLDCQRSGCTYYESQKIDALGHDMGDGYVYEEPKCETEGTQRADCNRCDYYEEEPIPALGHIEPEDYTYASVIDKDKQNESNGSIVELIQNGRKYKECTRKNCYYLFEEAYRQMVYVRYEKSDEPGTYGPYILSKDVYSKKDDEPISHTIDGGGWYEDLTVELSDYSTAHRYYLDIKLKQYSITYHGNNPNSSRYVVTNVPEPATGGYRANGNLSDQVPGIALKNGKTGAVPEFLGWRYTDSAGSRLYQPGDAFTVVKDTDLYAVWKGPVIEIVLNNYGANENAGTGKMYEYYGQGYYTNSEATDTFTDGKIEIPKKYITDNSLPDKKREQKFLGYYTMPKGYASDDYMTRIIEEDGTIIKNIVWSRSDSTANAGYVTPAYSYFTEDTTIYAHWENKYAIQFSDNLSDADKEILNKKENDEPIDFEEGEELVPVPKLQWKISGEDKIITYEEPVIHQKSGMKDFYRFKGWSLTPEITSEDEIVLSENKTSYTFTENKDITLYAQWDTSFTMAYMGNVQTEGTDYLEPVADIDGAYTFNPNEAEQVALLPNDDADYFVKTVEKETIDIETGEDITEEVPCSFGGWSMYSERSQQDIHMKYLKEDGERANSEVIGDAKENAALTIGTPKADFGTNDAPHPDAMNLLTNVYGEKPEEGPVAEYLNELAEMPYVNMYVIWDEYPQIHATDIYMSLAEAQSGAVTEEYLLNLATATDEELKSASNTEGKLNIGEDTSAGTSYTILDYQTADFTCAESEISFSITYRAEDAAGNVTTKLVHVYLVDTTGEPVNTGEVRFISAEHIDTLAADSIWRTGEYATKLAEVLGNDKTGVEYTTVTPAQAAFGAKSVAKPGSGTWDHVQQIWEFTHEEVLAVQAYVDSHKGTGDPAEFLANFGGNRVY